MVINMAGIGIRMKSASGNRHSVFNVSRVTPGRDTLFPCDEEEEIDDSVVTGEEVDNGAVVVMVLMGGVRLWAELLLSVEEVVGSG